MGPLPQHCANFWRMVLEHNVHSIIMVTGIIEGKKKKCAQYWSVASILRFSIPYAISLVSAKR
jgi:protein tyrosine phosphatase